jgi:hypothetical protein
MRLVGHAGRIPFRVGERYQKNSYYTQTAGTTLAVPAWANFFQAKVWGAGGAAGGWGGVSSRYGGNGGAGGFASGLVNALGQSLRGTNLTLKVGDAGSGGGAYAGGGGGYSGVFVGSTPLILAGGGGGGGAGVSTAAANGAGGAGGNSSAASAAGTGTGTNAGTGATSLAGGSIGGFQYGGANAGSVGSGIGGGGLGVVSDSANTNGGAGGGGYYGGGASTTGSTIVGGGGGGSNWLDGIVLNPVWGASTTVTPYNAADSDRSSAGNPGLGALNATAGAYGTDGAIIIEFFEYDPRIGYY